MKTTSFWLHFYLCAFWAHVDRWFSRWYWHAFLSHTGLMQVLGKCQNSNFFKLLEEFSVFMYCAIIWISLRFWCIHCQQKIVSGNLYPCHKKSYLHDRAYEKLKYTGIISNLPWLWNPPTCFYLDSMHCDHKSSSVLKDA